MYPAKCHLSGQPVSSSFSLIKHYSLPLFLIQKRLRLGTSYAGKWSFVQAVALIGLPLGLEAPVMTPNGVNFLFLFLWPWLLSCMQAFSLLLFFPLTTCSCVQAPPR